LRKIKPVLWETLQAFFENNLSITKTAKNIYIHRNTLIYRLGKIHKLTGLNPQKFDQALLLYIAFKIKQFQE
ncbi:MAG: helix-turn-helix domain-containing protein, partial [Atribacterota bacterium]|nr:helix-turn-helix domain-containing protein [Atribacterota bacterium]